jgi:hypothetical protein
MPFGQIPAVGMSHQEKGWTRIIADNQESTGFDFRHSKFLFLMILGGRAGHVATVNRKMFQ